MRIIEEKWALNYFMTLFAKAAYCNTMNTEAQTYNTNNVFK